MKLLRRKQVEEASGLSRSSIYQMMAEGRFPKPLKVGRRAVRWSEEDLKHWQEALLEQSND